MQRFIQQVELFVTYYQTSYQKIKIIVSLVYHKKDSRVSSLLLCYKVKISLFIVWILMENFVKQHQLEKERKVSEGHNGFVIYASPDITIEDDLARRDITINSMAIDLETNKLIDPFYGELDLRTETIRATTEAFVKIRFVCIVLQDLLQNMVSLLNTKHRR